MSAKPPSYAGRGWGWGCYRVTQETEPHPTHPLEQAETRPQCGDGGMFQVPHLKVSRNPPAGCPAPGLPLPWTEAGTQIHGTAKLLESTRQFTDKHPWIHQRRNHTETAPLRLSSSAPKV